MGAITRAAANNFTTGGVILPAAINDASVASISSLSQVSGGGAEVLISTSTASSSASVAITGLSTTYPVYKVEIINCHPGTNDTNLQVNFSSDGGSNYNVVKTTNGYISEHGEDGSPAQVTYNTFLDLDQSTSNQTIGYNSGSDNDQSVSGELWLFNPMGTTHVKQFFAKTVVSDEADDIRNVFVGGYINSTADVEAISFAQTSGNIDSGIFKLYGIKDS